LIARGYEKDYAWVASAKAVQETDPVSEVISILLCQLRSARAATDLRAQLERAREDIERARTESDNLRAQLVEAQREPANLCVQLEFARKESGEIRRRLQEAENRTEDALAKLLPFQRLGPNALWVARRLQALSSQHPRAASVCKRTLSLFGRRAG